MNRMIAPAVGNLTVQSHPTIPYIEGDGIGPEIWAATKRVIEAGVDKAYGNRRRIQWKEVLAGQKALSCFNDLMPEATLEAFRTYKVGIKGPLETPVGSGYRSLNATLRQKLDMYACIRPVSWIKGIPSPVLHPENLNVVIFREATEDLYAGIEWESSSEECRKVSSFLKDQLNCLIPENSGIGVKYASQTGSQRLIRKALTFAIRNSRKRVTVVHKGNIMKHTDGCFMKWAYELAREEFDELIVTEESLKPSEEVPEGKILLNDRIADNMFQQILVRSADYDVIVSPNLIGDFLSDAAAAQVGGIGIAPGANIGDFAAVFEPTHGTAPKYAGQDKANPTSLILSGVMMLRYIGWNEAANLILNGLQQTVLHKILTYDLARNSEGGKEVSTSEFGNAIISNL